MQPTISRQKKTSKQNAMPKRRKKMKLQILWRFYRFMVEKLYLTKKNVSEKKLLLRSKNTMKNILSIRLIKA